MITLINSQSPRARYIEEILDHAGIAWQQGLQPERGQSITIVHAGESLDAEQRDRLSHAVEEGGALIVIGGNAGLESLSGTVESVPIREGYIVAPDASHPITAAAHQPLHVFGGHILKVSDADRLAELEGGGVAIAARRVGPGAVVVFGPDIVWSVAHIQTGTPVTKDGAPAPDGSAPLDDDILKAEDGLVLDWKKDRQQTLQPGDVAMVVPGLDEHYPAGNTPWFSVPIADELRDLLLRAIAWAAAEVSAPLVAIDAWPEGVSAVGTISHDSDFNVDEHAHTTLRLLKQADITSTWCHIYGPNYEEQYRPDTFAQIIAAGHEMALHYNALPRDGGAWGQQHFRQQAQFVANEAGVEGFTTNKNHYTRWEGQTEFYSWMLDEGIQVDQSRGPSKKGTVGYPFGSSLPARPINPDTGEIYDLFVIPMQFQDLWLTAPPYQARDTIIQARRHRGVAHFLFHQIHVHTKPDVAQAFLSVINRGRDAGLEWWRSDEINAWERDRRRIHITPDGDWLAISGAPRHRTAVALVLATADEPDPVERYGQHWRPVPLRDDATATPMS